MTSDGEMMNEPAGPVIDDELVDCLMAPPVRRTPRNSGKSQLG